MEPLAGLVLCAGSGTRMQPLSDNIPKPLLPIDGKPVIVHTIDAMKFLGISPIGLIIQQDHQEIFDNFLQEFYPDDEIDIFVQDKLTGIITAIQASDYHGKSLLACAGDTQFLESNIRPFLLTLDINPHADAIIGITHRSQQELLRRSVIEIDDDYTVQSTIEKPTKDQLADISSSWSGVPIWYFARSCWDDFYNSQPSNNGEYAVEGVIKRINQRDGLVKAAELLGTRDITYPKDILLHNFEYISRIQP